MSQDNNQPNGGSVNTSKGVKPSKGKSAIEKVKGWVGSLFAESIFLDSKPAFVCYNKTTKKIEVQYMLEDENGIYFPRTKDSYGYEPYSFSTDELRELASSEITKESLLDEISEIVELHLYASDAIKHLVIGDILFTYCQEWITTTHYIFAVGETGSGKSTLTLHFKNLGYRCLYGANIPYANIYNFLGKDEEGAGTIAEDEAQSINNDDRKITIYKNSYNKGAKQPIIDMQDGRKQIFYWTFCFKVFSGEFLPNDKGLLERLAVCFMMQGVPKKNIKKPSPEDKEKLRKLRNRLLIWKMQNIETGIPYSPSLEVGRDEELYEDYLKIMSGTKYEDQAKKAVEYFTRQRHERIWNSTEAKIFRLVLKVKRENHRVYFQDLWNALRDGVEISVEQEGASFIDRDTGQKITFNFLAKTLIEKFRGKKMDEKEHRKENGEKKQKKMTYYVFDEKDLEELTKKYNIKPDSDQDQN